MSAFKQFLSTDVTVVPFVVNKSFTFEGTASLDSNDIKRLYGLSSSYSSSTDNTYSSYQSQSAALLYNSIKQLYYTNYIPTPSQSQAPSPVYNYKGTLISNYTSSATNARFYNYEQTTLFQTNSLNNPYLGYARYFSSSICVLSIPKNLFGDYINPNSFRLDISNGDGDNIYLIDNGEGILLLNGGVNDSTGIINYFHGTIAFNGTIFAQEYINWMTNATNVTCSFQSSRTIYETQYKCTLRSNEFNFSLNPSTISGSTEGTVYNFVTSSYFAPYATTVGLYNKKQELLAVAKLAKPLPTSATTDTTILINLDM